MKKTKKSKPRAKAKRPSAGTKPKQKMLFSIGDAPRGAKPTKQDEQLTREQAQDARNRALLGVIAPMTIAGHARQDAQTQRINEQYEHEAMVGEVVWHVHPKQ
jgi:hypothetical protein